MNLKRILNLLMNLLINSFENVKCECFYEWFYSLDWKNLGLMDLYKVFFFI